MRYPRLRGKRFISLARCSGKNQADTSIDDQLGVIGAFGDEHEMQYVDKVELDGVTGSVPGARTDINMLIARKKERDDFDVVLIHDATRLTRAGARHGNKIIYDLEAAGVEVVGVMDNLPDNEFADVIQTLQFSSAKQTAKATSLASTRGSQSALVAGRSAYCRRPPYAIDRMYCADGQASHIIRNLGNGTQLKLDPKTGEIIGQFGRRVRSGTSTHYIKQKHETIQLVPGDHAHVAVVSRIFSRHFVDGWGSHLIATELNNEGTPSPNGGKWHTVVVDRILRNPIYLGRGIANRTTRAIYFRRGTVAPEPVSNDAKTLASRKRPAVKYRESADWIIRQEDHLSEMIDPAICKFAEAKQQTQLERRAVGLATKPNRDRHHQSQYILKNILRTSDEHGNLSFTGRLSRKDYRYYALNRARTCPDSNVLFRRTIRAEPLERAVLEIVSFCLSQTDDLRQQVKSAIDAEAARGQIDSSEFEELKRERQTLLRKIEVIIDELADLGRDAFQEKINQMKSRVIAIDRLLAEARAESGKATAQISVDVIVAKLSDLANQVDHLPPASLRRLLDAIISKAEVDLATAMVTVELRLPKSLLRDENAVCLVEQTARKPSNEAHPSDCLLLSKTTLVPLLGIGLYWPVGAGIAA